MSYSITIPIAAGTAYPSISDWAAQLLNTDGTSNGSSVSTGFVNIGAGNYSWTGTIPASFQGTVKFTSAGSSLNLVGGINQTDDPSSSGGGDATLANQTKILKIIQAQQD